MVILSVNAGSSSLKFQAFDMPEEKLLISGVFEKIGLKDSFYTIKVNGEKIKHEVELKNHERAFELLVKELIDNNIVDSLEDIKAIGHRVVQGGEYSKSTEITNEVIKMMKEYESFTPLHTKSAISGIKAAQSIAPDAMQVAVFDTSFHQTIEEENFIYPIPYEWYTEYNIRKFGYHGTSHKYVSSRVNEILGRYNTKVITCHLGNGASVCAIEDGMCVNTTLGVSANSGLMMGSRSGDLDPTIVTYMMNKLNVTPDEMSNILNKESGLLGVSGISSDSRDIEDGIKKGNSRCALAQKMFVRRVIDAIAKFYVELGGCDAIVFTAGIGENSIHTRREVMDGLEVLGVKVDEEANECRGEEKLITLEDSSIPCYVIPTNEELMMARDAYNIKIERDNKLADNDENK